MDEEMHTASSMHVLWGQYDMGPFGDGCSKVELRLGDTNFEKWCLAKQLNINNTTYTANSRFND
jgi:hypothetical protein